MNEPSATRTASGSASGTSMTIRATPMTTPWNTATPYAIPPRPAHWAGSVSSVPLPRGSPRRSSAFTAGRSKAANSRATPIGTTTMSRLCATVNARRRAADARLGASGR